MSNATVSWKSDPDFRGTFNILSTCLSTLLICVWSAVHDDIAKGKQGFRAIVRRIGWLIIGLLAPELLLYISFSQYVTAKRILRDAEEAFGMKSPRPSRSWLWILLGRRAWSKPHSEDNMDTLSELPLRTPTNDSSDKSPDPPYLKGVYERKHPWTLTHAFFAAMGGFKLDGHDDEGQYYLPAWQGEALITPQGITFLLKHAPHLIPDISAEEIKDRSKADGLAKALLVWQVIWFCINSGARLAQGLPLSLLEVSTIAHGVSTLITYCFWWEKPLNVREPILVGGPTKESAALGAWMSIASDAERNILLGITNYEYYGEHHRLTYVLASRLLEAAKNVDPTSDSPTFVLEAGDYGFLTGPSTSKIDFNDLLLYTFTLSGEHVITASPQWPDHDLPDTLLRAEFGESYTIDLTSSAESPGEDAVILPLNYTSDTISRPFDWNEPWNSLVRVLRAYKANFVYRGQPPWDFPVNRDRPQIEADPTCLRRWRHAGTLPRYTHLPLQRIQVTDSPLIVPVATLQSSLTFLDQSTLYIADILLSTMLPAAYGLPHLLGWNAAFPTHVEQVLWRTAALVVAASGWLVWSFGGLLVLIDRAVGHWFGWMTVRDVTRNVVQMVVIPVAAVSYVSASGYLLVESFKQLFALPPGAFQLPSWANSIPHFT